MAVATVSNDSSCARHNGNSALLQEINGSRIALIAGVVFRTEL